MDAAERVLLSRSVDNEPRIDPAGRAGASATTVGKGRCTPVFFSRKGSATFSTASLGPRGTAICTMTAINSPRDFDEEVAALLALATSLADVSSLPQAVYPAPSVGSLPGVYVVSTGQEGEHSADAREDCS